MSTPDSLAVIRNRIIEQWGWKPCNIGEFKIIQAFHRIGVEPSMVEQQFRLGQYRIDFAFVRERVAIEADGWVHTAGSVTRRDRERDERLQQWGWQTERIDIDQDEDAIERQVFSVVDMLSRETLHTKRLKDLGGIILADVKCPRCHYPYRVEGRGRPVRQESEPADRN